MLQLFATFLLFWTYADLSRGENLLASVGQSDYKLALIGDVLDGGGVAHRRFYNRDVTAYKEAAGFVFLGKLLGAYEVEIVKEFLDEARCDQIHVYLSSALILNGGCYVLYVLGKILLEEVDTYTDDGVR